MKHQILLSQALDISALISTHIPKDLFVVVLGVCVSSLLPLLHACGLQHIIKSAFFFEYGCKYLGLVEEMLFLYSIFLLHSVHKASPYYALSPDVNI